MKRYVILFIITFVFVNLASYFYFEKIYTAKTQSYLDSKLKTLEFNYINSIDILEDYAQLIFKNNIQTDEVYKILRYLPDSSQSEQQYIRNELYEHILSLYKVLKKDISVRQFHFHLPDGRSFLRMHRPDKYGDLLFDVRPSIKIANTKRIYVKGFEEGRIFNGYRFVYPLIINEQHFGSVEISVSINAIINYMKKISKNNYCFIIKTLTVNEKVFSDEKSNYVKSILSPWYLHDKEINNEYCTKTIQTLLEKIKQDDVNIKQLENSQPFSTVITDNGKIYRAEFLPIENTIHNAVAYIYSVEQDSVYQQYYLNLISRLILTLICTLALTLFFLFLMYRNHYIKSQSLKLETQVIQRTELLNNSLEKEKRYIRLLDVIKSIDKKILYNNKIEEVFQFCVNQFTTLPSCVFSIISVSIEGQYLFYSNECEHSQPNKKLICDHISILVQNYNHPNNKQVIIINDLKSEKSLYQFLEMFEENGIKKLIVLPLANESTLKYFGNLIFFTSRGEQFEEHEQQLFNELSKTISSAISIDQNKKVISSLKDNKLKSYKEMIFSLVELTEQRDIYTAGHTRRVAKYSLLIGRQLDLSNSQLEILEDSAVLHDIGKVVTPDSILLKPDKLSFDEYTLIKNHVIVGEKILSSIGLFSELANIIKYHHERYDGSGYPYGLKGDEIPLLSQILSIADAFDAMTTNRIYKPRKSVYEALEELNSLSNRLFSSDVVESTLVALKGTEVDTNTSQLPGKEIEHQRTSYFFKDQLTGIFNKDYLRLQLNFPKKCRHCILNIISINGMNLYNKNNGWEKGDKLLILIANKIVKKFPDFIHFRVYGDLFILLGHENIELPDNLISESETSLHIELSCIELNTELDFENAIDSLSKHQY